MLIRSSLILVLCLASFLHPDLNSAQTTLDPFQQELKARLAQRMQAMQAKLEKMPVIAKQAGAQKPKPSIVQQEIKEREARSAAQMPNAFWGTAQNVKKLWDELQKLLVDRKAGSWDEPNWKPAAYNRLGEIRDVDAPKISPALAQFLPDYIIAYGELSGNARDIFLKTADTLASALFGNAPLSTEVQGTIKKMIADLRQLSPKTLKLADIIKNIAQARAKAAAPAQKPSKNGDVKHEADIKKQKAEQCLEDLRKFYRDDLEQQRRELMDIFYEITGMNEQQFLNYVKNNRNEIIADVQTELANNKSISKYSRFFQITQRLLEKNNLQNIAVLNDNTAGFIASALYIKIDIEHYAYLDDTTIAAIVLHEIQHILFDDPVIIYCITTLMENSPFEETFLQMFSFFIEKRADILAWLTSPEHAKAGMKFHGNKPLDVKFAVYMTHISAANREAMGNALYKQMLSCYEQ